MIDDRDIEQLKETFTQKHHVHSGSDTPRVNYGDLSSLPFLAQFGGNGSDGVLSIASGTTTINLGGSAVVTKNYISIAITGTAKLAFSNPHANGTIIILKSQGDVVITSTTIPAIDASGMGAAGGSAGTGCVGNNLNGGGGAGGASMVADGGAGSGQNPAGTCSPGGGGTGTSGLGTGKNTGGTGGLPAGTGSSASVAGGLSFGFQSSLGISLKGILLIPGAGGGGGGGGTNAGYTGGVGGFGGGALYIECNGSLTISSTLSVAGKVGGGVTACSFSGGNAGGGAGGCILIAYRNLISNTGVYTVSGGAAETACSGTAGAGANGWSAVVKNTEFVYR